MGLVRLIRFVRLIGFMGSMGSIGQFNNGQPKYLAFQLPSKHHTQIETCYSLARMYTITSGGTQIAVGKQSFSIRVTYDGIAEVPIPKGKIIGCVQEKSGVGYTIQDGIAKACWPQHCWGVQIRLINVSRRTLRTILTEGRRCSITKMQNNK